MFACAQRGAPSKRRTAGISRRTLAPPPAAARRTSAAQAPQPLQMLQAPRTPPHEAGRAPRAALRVRPARPGYSCSYGGGPGSQAPYGTSAGRPTAGSLASRFSRVFRDSIGPIGPSPRVFQCEAPARTSPNYLLQPTKRLASRYPPRSALRVVAGLASLRSPLPAPCEARRIRCVSAVRSAAEAERNVAQRP